MVEKIKFSKEEMMQNKTIQKLKTSELKYRVLVENLPQKIFLKDCNSVYISCNDNLAKDLKIRAEDIAGKTDYDFFPKNLADKYRADDKRILNSGETEEIDEDYIEGDKKVFVHTVKTPIEDENGYNIGILGIFWDVTERKIAAQKIKESEKKFKTLTKNIPGMVYRAKPDWSTEIITGSEAICGYSIEEFNSQEINWLDIIHAEDKEDVLNESSKMLSKPMEFIQEYRIITKDGSPRWVEDHKISFFHEDGSFLGIDGVVFDITNRKDMEQKLEESEEWLSTMLKSIGDGIIAIDINGMISFLNPVAESLTGWTQENAIGQHIENVFKIINEFTHNSVENPALKALQENTVNGLSRYSLLISKDKREIFIDDTGAPIKDNEGNIIGAVLIFKDITKRRIAEKKLQESEHNLRERIKEITCLYGLSKLVENPDSTTEDILQGMIDLIPSSLQFPEKSCVRIIFNNEEYKTSNFMETGWKISTQLDIKENLMIIEVYYLEKRPFLKEEEYLLNDIGKRLKTIIEQKRADIELRDNEEKFRAISGSAHDAIIQTDQNNRIIFWNKAAEKNFGYSSEEISGKNITIVIPEQFRGAYRKNLLNIMNTMDGISIGRTIEVKGLKKDGSEFPTELSFSVFYMKGKRNTISIARDITERKLYEKHLELAHNQLDQLFNASIPMYITDMEFNVIKVNERFCKQIQLESNEIIGMKCYDIWKGQLCNTEDCSLIQIKRGVDQYEYEIERILNDDTKANYIVKNYPFRNHNNELIGCIKTFTDITKRIKIEQRLRDSEEKYRSVLENISEGYFEANLKGNITFINEGFSEIVGYSQEELINSHYSKIYDQRNKSLVFKVYNSLYTAAEGFTVFDCEAIKKKGEKIFIESSVYLKYDNFGKIIGFKGFLRNITERKQAEVLGMEFNKILETEVMKRTKELNQALEKQKLYLDQIIKASNFKTEFLGTVSHELRTPLNAMIGFTDLLLEGCYGPINKEQSGFLQDVKNSAEHQYEMIKHILDISKIESGQVSINIEKIQFQNLIKQIISTLKPLYSEKKIKIKLKGIDKNSFIFADTIKFKQIIYNLLSNALKFTEMGIISLEFKDDSGNWEFNVRDTGIGIAEEDFDLIFKDFKRVNSPYVNSKPGSGLGLALTRRIINLHGGSISFTSKVGKGTTFTFTIPKNYEINNKIKKNKKEYI